MITAGTNTSITWELNFHGSYSETRQERLYPALVYKSATIEQKTVGGVLVRDTVGDHFERVDNLAAVGGNGAGQVLVDGNLHRLVVRLSHSGYEAAHTLDVPESGRISPNHALGQKENLRLEADIKTITACDRPGAPHAIAGDDELLYVADLTGSGEPEARSLGAALSDSHVNPILYIEQPGGYMQLSEVRYPNDEVGLCRLLFSLVMGDPTRQHHILTQPYRPGNNPHTVAVIQDGDSLSNHSYFEFWFQNTHKIGHFPIARSDFPFYHDKPSRIGIGYWPRQEPLFFHGDIYGVKVDPHGVCPC